MRRPRKQTPVIYPKRRRGGYRTSHVPRTHVSVTRWVGRMSAVSLLLPVLVWGLMQVTRLPLGSVWVDGERVDISRAGARALRAHAEAWEHARVVVSVGPYLVRMPRAEFGARLPVRETQERLQSIGRRGSPLRDMAELWGSHTGGLRFSLAAEVERAAVVAAMGELRRLIERAPVPGTRTPEGELIPGIPGITINVLTAVERLQQGLRSGADTIALQFSSIAPPAPVAYDDPTTSLFNERMAVFETKYRRRRKSGGRAQNIEAAARAVDGAVLPPGGRLSFNEAVGERTLARGFSAAKELANRRVVEGVGGGVCQLAATLHAAAFLSGFDIPVYQPHSRPASYIETGLDTMVSWPDKDLVIRNPYPFAVRIRASARDGLARVTLYGAGRAHPVEWDKQELARTKGGIEELPDEDLEAGERKVLRRGIDGLVIERRRTKYLPTGPVIEKRKIRYPVHNMLVAVGPGA